MLTIGFADKFYTLWDVTTETNYVTDSYGKHWPSHETTRFSYIKNISMDLDKVKELYPDTPIVDTLHGHNRSFSQDGDKDLSPELFKNGMYSMKTILEVAEIDVKYLVWYKENGWKSATIKLISELPQVVAYYADLEAEKQAKISAYKDLKSGVYTGTFRENPNNTLDSWYYSEDCKKTGLNGHQNSNHARLVLEDGTEIFVLFPEVKNVAGLYPYTMAKIGDKFAKLKNKEYTLNLNIIHRDCNQHYCYHFATIA
jgi:hypothetical protein